MKNYISRLSITLLALFMALPLFSQSPIEPPAKFFGFQPGANRQLLTYEQSIKYFKLLDAASDRLKLVRIGTSPMGKPMYMALISNAKNIANLDKLKKINKELALNPNLTEAQRQQMVRDGKVFIYATLSMHSSEVGPSQAAPLIAWQLITTQDSAIRSWLDKVVYMMVPCHNPDGMDMVVNNYLKYRGTKYEGATLPGVYHKYVGHDNNRDFVNLTQTDTKAIAAVYDTSWYPQVMVEKHQMRSVGPRFFVPPYTDAIAQVIDANLWNWMKIFGGNMIEKMTADSLKGVIQMYEFDDYWPGSTETCLWKNVIGMLTECANAKLATPVYVEPTELTTNHKGLSEYKKVINMPDPWPGGWWGLPDITKYEISSTQALIKTAALHKTEILKFRNDLCRKDINKGKTEAPYFYLLPQKQHDQSELADLIRIMQEQGVNVYRLTRDVTLDNYTYHRGDIVIPLAQPYRPFIKEVMEIQHYPVRHFTAGGKVIRPYDITSWSLPLHKGLESHEIDVKADVIGKNLEKLPLHYNFLQAEKAAGWGLAFRAGDNESYKEAFALLSQGVKVYRTDAAVDIDGKPLAKGSFVVKSGKALKTLWSKLTVTPVSLPEKPAVKMHTVTLPRIALMETYFNDMDAGWTRFIFDTYHIPFTVIHPGEVANTDLSRFDVFIFPDMRSSVTMYGKNGGDFYYSSDLPPAYTKGMGKAGLEKVMSYVNNGGKVLSWGRSTDLFLGQLTDKNKNGQTEHFVLPYRNDGPALKKKGLYCPGTFIKVDWKPDNPLTLGMEPTSGVFYRGNPVFRTTQPGFDMDRRVIGTFPEKGLLLSGYAENLKLAGNHPAMIWMRKGKGEMVLYSFSPIFRASTPVTFKLVFNALLMNQYRPKPYPE
jgi:hypothetical protein